LITAVSNLKYISEPENCQFWVSEEKSESKNHLVSWKNQKRKSSFQSGYLTFSSFWRTMVTYQNWIFDCFEEDNYEPEEPAYTW
jgi:hypothetical protein